jgi:hypothetical protein
MFRLAKWAAPVAALALMIGLTVSKVTAEEVKEGKGTVSGKVVDKDGAAVADAKVRLMNQAAGAKKADKAAGETKAADASEKPKGEKPVPVAEATTDSEGKFTMPDVPAGSYRVMVNVKGKGRAGDKVEVKAGETATVELKLEDAKPKAPAAK